MKLFTTGLDFGKHNNKKQTMITQEQQAQEMEAAQNVPTPTLAERPQPSGNCMSEQSAQEYYGKQVVAVKELRRDIDSQIQKVKGIYGNSHERSLVVTKLQEAVMWLGMDLKRINEECPGVSQNPYPNSKDPSNTKIDPTADGLKL